MTTGWVKSTRSISGECVEVGQGWRKSSGSHANGNCVEIGQEAAGDYRKSSLSMNNGACAEVGSAPGAVLVRDTADRDGVTLAVAPGAWKAFTRALRDGQAPS